MQDVQSQVFCFFLVQADTHALDLRSHPQGVRYFELPGCTRLANPGGRLTVASQGQPEICFESVRQSLQLVLLMCCESSMRVTVNGLRSLSLNTLSAGDVIGIDDHVLQLSLRNRPYVGSPRENHQKTKCGYCRMPIQDAEGMRIYACPTCEGLTHWQGADIPAEQRLECALLSSRCGHCQAEIIEAEGFSHVPRL